MTRPSYARRSGGDRRVRTGRARPAPRPRLRRVLVPAVLGLVTVLVLLAFFTPVLGVRSVEVVGTRALGEREVRRAAGIQLGTPMLRVDESEIRERLSSIDRIDSVHVELSWPSTVRLEVAERVPVAFDSTLTGVRLIDDEGVAFAEVEKPLAKLPEIRVPNLGPEDAATQAALTVLEALGKKVREQVTAVVVEEPGNVRLLLTKGREVEWGSTRLTARKAAILGPLLTRPGKVYDVTSPALPTVS